MAEHTIKNEEALKDEDVKLETSGGLPPAAYYSPPAHLSPDSLQSMPIPFESLDFSLDPTFLEVDEVYDPTLGGKRIPTGSSILEPDAILDTDGRTYHSYTQGSLYFLPNDGKEQDRLDWQHSIFALLLDGALGLAPITSPSHVLDIATGTGIWAVDFAERYPSSYVVGTDLSSIQPSGRLSNCEFIREDSESSEWIFPYLFDYVHLRNIVWCFDDTKNVFRKAFDAMVEGGWIEIQDPSLKMYSMDGSFEGGEADRFAECMLEGLGKIGRVGNRIPLYKGWLEEVGFVDVVERIIPCPVGGWPKNPKMKKIGLAQQHNVTEGIPSGRKMLMLAGLDEAEVDRRAECSIKEMHDPNIHGIMNVYIVYGRKP